MGGEAKMECEDRGGAESIGGGAIYVHMVAQ